MIGKKRKLVVGAIIAVVIAIVAAVIGSNRATAAPIYGDTSATVSPFTLTDHGPHVSTPTPLTTPVTVLPASIQFQVIGTPPFLGADTWQVSPATLDGYALQINSAGLLTLTPISGATQTIGAGAIAVSATDVLGATGLDTVTIGFVDATHSSLTQVSHNLLNNIFGLNNNANGQVDFSLVPTPAPAVTWSAGNLPNGTAMASNGILTATSSIPGAYNEVPVRATDSGGATAVAVVDLTIKGAIVGNDTPRLSHGYAVAGINSSRENVFYEQDGSPSWDHFTIVGPGAINGHQGWVHGQLGLNEAVYGGLLAGHGYTVFYQPVTGPGSTTPWPGAHWGYVYFISGR